MKQQTTQDNANLEILNIATLSEDERVRTVVNEAIQVQIIRSDVGYIVDILDANGELIETGKILYCMYIKEEVDSSKAQYGRIKLHYPLGLKYEDSDIDIDNKYIINLIYCIIKFINYWILVYLVVY